MIRFTFYTCLKQLNSANRSLLASPEKESGCSDHVDRECISGGNGRVIRLLEGDARTSEDNEEEDEGMGMDGEGQCRCCECLSTADGP
jgi:hypothetical protein